MTGVPPSARRPEVGGAVRAGPPERSLHERGASTRTPEDRLRVEPGLANAAEALPRVDRAGITPAICEILRPPDRPGGDHHAVGLGFVIPHRQIVTCAHVVNTVLCRELMCSSPPVGWPRIMLRFPFAPQVRTTSTAPRILRAIVTHWGPSDIADPESGDIAILRTAEDLSTDFPALPLDDRSDLGRVPVQVFGPVDRPGPNGPERMVRQNRIVCGTATGKLPGYRWQFEHEVTGAFRVTDGFSGGPVCRQDVPGHPVIGIFQAGLRKDGEQAREASRNHVPEAAYFIGIEALDALTALPPEPVAEPVEQSDLEDPRAVEDDGTQPGRGAAAAWDRARWGPRRWWLLVACAVLALACLATVLWASSAPVPVPVPITITGLVGRGMATPLTESKALQEALNRQARDFTGNPRQTVQLNVQEVSGREIADQISDSTEGQLAGDAFFLPANAVAGDEVYKSLLRRNILKGEITRTPLFTSTMMIGVSPQGEKQVEAVPGLITHPAGKELPVFDFHRYVQYLKEQQQAAIEGRGGKEPWFVRTSNPCQGATPLAYLTLVAQEELKGGVRALAGDESRRDNPQGVGALNPGQRAVVDLLRPQYEVQTEDTTGDLLNDFHRDIVEPGPDTVVLMASHDVAKDVF